jgi:tRNA A-37 threonylcarbamoyl transferase component Bud32
VSSVLVARFVVRSGVAPIVRAALDVDIVYVALSEPPPAGRNTLQLFVGDEMVGAVGAELVGSGRDGEYPLRVRLLDQAHAVELGRLIDPRTSLAAEGPRPSRKSVREAPSPSEPPPSGFGDEEKTLASRAQGSDAPDRTLASRAPHIDDERTLTSRRLPTPVPEPSVLAAPVAIARSPDEPRQPRPRSIRESYFTDDESETLPGSSRVPGLGPTSDASWNVRIAPTTKDPLCGRTIGGGKYILDSVIGTGAIGIVFKASHKDLGRTVAIKVLNPRYRDDPDLLAVFRTEARAASQLEHPNVARVYDYGQEPDGLVYIVMEYLSGYTLGSVLSARRKLTPARAVDVMIQVCAGLSAAHDRDIVHRDIKPDNIVLVPAQDDEGRPVEIVKVCDFGIAALGTTRTDEGNAAGTPEYMAPEQSTGSSVSPSADVYACGCALYEMLTGQVPFTADQAYRILMKHRNEAPCPPSEIEPGIAPALEAAILRCMEKAPARRYQSARELRVELRKIADAKAS